MSQLKSMYEDLMRLNGCANDKGNLRDNLYRYAWSLMPQTRFLISLLVIEKLQLFDQLTSLELMKPEEHYVLKGGAQVYTSLMEILNDLIQEEEKKDA